MNFLQRLFQRHPKIDRVDISKRFELVGRVGQGSMSKVWRARDFRTGKSVAVKVLDFEKTKRLEARFGKLAKPTEGEVAMTLKHPRIVATLEHGITTNDEQFLVMEFVEGAPLSFLVEAQSPFFRSNCLRLAIELGEAIDYFHKAKWIHRDICPRNVIVDTENHVKLIDFGLVVPNTPPFQAPGNRTGTANYMAPELIKRHKTDQRIDIFSYSVTVYEMFAKYLPWRAGETLEAVMQHINTPPDPIETHVKTVPPGVATIIMKGLSRHPDDRWQTMSEMVSALRQERERLGRGAEMQSVSPKQKS